jgi:ATP-dependent 26S proteasome regulatory subunit
MMVEDKIGSELQQWQEANRAYLMAETQRLRLLLQRRVLWLRRQWRHDPVQNYQGMVITESEADWLLAGEDPSAETRFYREDPEAAALTGLLGEAEQKIAALRRQFESAPPAIDLLARLFGLVPFERDVLLLCLAPELDPAFDRLYAYVQDDVTRKYATPHLALALFGGEDGWGGQSFVPEAPLRRFRLVTLGPAHHAAVPGARPLYLEDRVAHYIQGVNRLDERLENLLRPAPPAPLTPDHRDQADRLARWVGARRGRRVLLNLVGPPGAGKQVVARALCESLGLQLFTLEVKRLPAPGPDRADMMRLLEREAVLLQFALYVDAVELESLEAVEDLGVFLIAGSESRCRTEREILAVPVPKPDAAGQRTLWEQALAGYSLHGRAAAVDAIVQQFDFGPRAIAQAAAAAGLRWRLRIPEETAGPAAEDLWEACRDRAGAQLKELAQRIVPCYTWDHIVLPDDVFRQLQEIAAQVAHRPCVYESWGFGALLQRGRGISALFSGPSGTGKTMAAEILAHHLKLDLYRIDLAGVVNKYIGETEKNLKKVFEAAEESGSILFFDEADALFGKRTEQKDSHDRYANIEVNYLLQRMEDYRGLAILATNRKSALDRAFLRRLRFLVDFPFPDASARRRIWRKVFPPQTPLESVDYDALSRLELAGGNIRNIALNAAFLAAGASAGVGMPHLMHAARREYAKIDKLITDAEFGAYYKLVKP